MTLAALRLCGKLPVAEGLIRAA
ncbi:MAG: hypothetical protein QOG69_963, partial [Actinomycetota bacterium]|nr:hypothetical protein [Actinomycetota bacterium]